MLLLEEKCRWMGMWSLNPERLWSHRWRNVNGEKSLAEDIHGLAHRVSPFLTVPWFLPYNSGKSHETCQGSQIAKYHWTICCIYSAVCWSLIAFGSSCKWLGPRPTKLPSILLQLKEVPSISQLFEFKLFLSAVCVCVWGGGEGLKKFSWIINHIGSKCYIGRMLKKSASENMKM